MRRIFSLLAGFLLGSLMMNSDNSSSMEDSQPSGEPYERQSFSEWFKGLTERASTQDVYIAPLDENERRRYIKP